MPDDGVNGQVRAELTMTVRPGDVAGFERECAVVRDWVRRQPGCLRQTLCRAAAPEPTYVITSDWIDLDAFRRFETSAEQDQVTARLRGLRTSARMRLLDVVAHVECDAEAFDSAG